MAFYALVLLMAAVPDQPWSCGADLGGTLLDRPGSGGGSGWRMGRALALGVTVGRRIRTTELFLRVEGNYWTSLRSDQSHDAALAVNVGPGGEIRYAGGRLRTGGAAGLSILAIPTDNDRAGSLGVFLELRPIGYLFHVDAATTVGIDPLSFHLTVPVLTGIPLVEIEYRTSVHAERRF